MVISTAGASSSHCEDTLGVTQGHAKGSMRPNNCCSIDAVAQCGGPVASPAAMGQGSSFSLPTQDVTEWLSLMHSKFSIAFPELIGECIQCGWNRYR